MSGRFRTLAKAALGLTAINLSPVGIDLDPIIYSHVEDLVVETLTLPAASTMLASAVPLAAGLPSREVLVEYADPVVWFLFWCCLCWWVLSVFWEGFDCSDRVRRRWRKWRRPETRGGDDWALVVWVPPVLAQAQIAYDINLGTAAYGDDLALVLWRPHVDMQITISGGVEFLAIVIPLLKLVFSISLVMARQLRIASADLTVLRLAKISLEQRLLRAVRKVEESEQQVEEWKRKFADQSNAHEQELHDYSISLHHKYAEERREMRQALKDAEDKAKRAKASKHELEKQVSDQQKTIRDFELAVASSSKASEDNKELIEVNDRLTERNDQLLEANDNLTQERDDIKSDNEKLVHDIEALKNQSSSNDLIAKLEAENAGFIAELREMKQDLEAKVATSQKAIEEQASQAAATIREKDMALAQQNATANESISRVQGENKTLQSRIVELQDAENKQRAAAAEDRSDILGQVQAAMKTVTSKEEECTRLRSELKSAKDELANVLAALSTSQAVASSAAANDDEAKDKLRADADQRTAQQINALQAEVAKLNEDKDHIMSEGRREFAELNAKIAERDAQLAAYLAQMAPSNLAISTGGIDPNVQNTNPAEPSADTDDHQGSQNDQESQNVDDPMDATPTTPPEEKINVTYMPNSRIAGVPDQSTNPVQEQAGAKSAAFTFAPAGFSLRGDPMNWNNPPPPANPDVINRFNFGEPPTPAFGDLDGGKRESTGEESLLIVKKSRTASIMASEDTTAKPRLSIPSPEEARMSEHERQLAVSQRWRDHNMNFRNHLPLLDVGVQAHRDQVEERRKDEEIKKAAQQVKSPFTRSSQPTLPPQTPRKISVSLPYTPVRSSPLNPKSQSQTPESKALLAALAKNSRHLDLGPATAASAAIDVSRPSLSTTPGAKSSSTPQRSSPSRTPASPTSVTTRSPSGVAFASRTPLYNPSPSILQASKGRPMTGFQAGMNIINALTGSGPGVATQPQLGNTGPSSPTSPSPFPKAPVATNAKGKDVVIPTRNFRTGYLTPPRPSAIPLLGPPKDDGSDSDDDDDLYSADDIKKLDQRQPAGANPPPNPAGSSTQPQTPTPPNESGPSQAAAPRIMAQLSRVREARRLQREREDRELDAEFKAELERQEKETEERKSRPQSGGRMTSSALLRQARRGNIVAIICLRQFEVSGDEQPDEDDHFDYRQAETWGANTYLITSHGVLHWDHLFRPQAPAYRADDRFAEATPDSLLLVVVVAPFTISRTPFPSLDAGIDYRGEVFEVNPPNDEPTESMNNSHDDPSIYEDASDKSHNVQYIGVDAATGPDHPDENILLAQKISELQIHVDELEKGLGEQVALTARRDKEIARQRQEIERLNAELKDAKSTRHRQKRRRTTFMWLITSSGRSASSRLHRQISSRTRKAVREGEVIENFLGFARLSLDTEEKPRHETLPRPRQGPEVNTRPKYQALTEQSIRLYGCPPPVPVDTPTNLPTSSIFTQDRPDSPPIKITDTAEPLSRAEQPLEKESTTLAAPEQDVCFQEAGFPNRYEIRPNSIQPPQREKAASTPSLSSETTPEPSCVECPIPADAGSGSPPSRVVIDVSSPRESPPAEHLGLGEPTEGSPRPDVQNPVSEAQVRHEGVHDASAAQNYEEAPAPTPLSHAISDSHPAVGKIGQTQHKPSLGYKALLRNLIRSRPGCSFISGRLVMACIKWAYHRDWNHPHRRTRHDLRKKLVAVRREKRRLNRSQIQQQYVQGREHSPLLQHHDEDVFMTDPVENLFTSRLSYNNGDISVDSTMSTNSSPSLGSSLTSLSSGMCDVGMAEISEKRDVEMTGGYLERPWTLPVAADIMQWQWDGSWTLSFGYVVQMCHNEEVEMDEAPADRKPNTITIPKATMASSDSQDKNAPQAIETAGLGTQDWDTIPDLDFSSDEDDEKDLPPPTIDMNAEERVRTRRWYITRPIVGKKRAFRDGNLAEETPYILSRLRRARSQLVRPRASAKAANDKYKTSSKKEEAIVYRILSIEKLLEGRPSPKRLRTCEDREDIDLSPHQNKHREGVSTPDTPDTPDNDEGSNGENTFVHRKTERDYAEDTPDTPDGDEALDEDLL
ncbi:MAG: hypothetical protein Q9220_003784 [cf. Caloplaca sp. 1 TL-2023]